MESDGASSEVDSVLQDDSMAALEHTHQASTAPVDAGQEVDFFAAELDRYTSDLRGSTGEKRDQIFKLLDSYYNYSRNRADKLQRHHRGQLLRKSSVRKGTHNDSRNDHVTNHQAVAKADELGKVEEEARTWDLLRRLLDFRYRGNHGSLTRDGMASRSCETRNEYWNEFMLTNSAARERKIVLEWLQNSAKHGRPIDELVSELQQNAERGDILAHGWLHTRHKIKLQKTVNARSGVLEADDGRLADTQLGSHRLVTQLDPDAMTRQSRQLEPQDEAFERAVWLGSFDMLRRGCSLAEIRDWCLERTEAWRAATICPLPLSSPDDVDQANLSPNAVILWRRMCYASARNGGTSDYERAVYGLLAGDVESVERVCRTWDDFLFAQYNALLRTQFDLFLIKQGGRDASEVAAKFPVHHAIMQAIDASQSARRVVAGLEEDERTGKEATSVAKALQAAVLTNDLDRHMYQQGVVVSRDANEQSKSKMIGQPPAAVPTSINTTKFFDLSDHGSHRIMAHVLIIVNALDSLAGATQDGKGPLLARHLVQEEIIVAYASYLRLAGLEDLVPLYCSKLGRTRLYPTLGRNLMHLTDADERWRKMNIMKRLGIDVRAFAAFQPEMFLEDVQERKTRCEAQGAFEILRNESSLRHGRWIKPDFFGEEQDLVEPENERLITAIEWLLLVDGLFLETCAYAIRVYKYFLKRMNLRAARAFSLRVGARTLVTRKTSKWLALDNMEGETMGSGDIADLEAADFPDEMLAECGQTKGEICATVKTLWQLESFVRALDAIETLSSLAELSREEPFGRSREMWHRAAAEIRTTKACMRPVLHNWLLERVTPDPDLSALRSAYLTETILAYISCLHFVGTSLSRDNLMECMDLGAMIAAKGSDLCQEFLRAKRMTELLEALAAASKALTISAADKKGGGGGGGGGSGGGSGGGGGRLATSKRWRENGWDKNIWSVDEDEVVRGLTE